MRFRKLFGTVSLAVVIAVAGIGANATQDKPDITEQKSQVMLDMPVPTIVYDDIEAEPDNLAAHHLPYLLTSEDREWICEIVAGHAAGESVTCQTYVAQVIYNDMMDQDGDLLSAMKKYHLNRSGVVTENTAEAVSLIFDEGIQVLDADVLWMNDVHSFSAFHESLETVCTIGNMNFYKER